MTSAPTLFDRCALARRRQRAARRWSAGSTADFLLRRSVEDLGDRLAAVLRTFPVAVVLGANGGAMGRLLRCSGRHATVIEIDPVRAMLSTALPGQVQADEEALPLARESVDLVVSPLVLQWVNDLPGTLAQVRQALRPDGLLLASLVGGETLTELRQAFIAAESEVEGGASPRVAPFADARDVAGLLQRAGLALPVVDSEKVTTAYRDLIALMHDLRAMGATNVLAERRRTPLRRATLARACAIYGERFSRGDGRIVATFEIVTLAAWAPAASQPKPLAPGSATHRLADALGTREVKLGNGV